MNILDCYFNNYRDTEYKQTSAEQISELEDMLEAIYIYAITWSLGCTTNNEGRRKFSTKLREIINQQSP